MPPSYSTSGNHILQLGDSVAAFSYIEYVIET